MQQHINAFQYAQHQAMLAAHQQTRAPVGAAPAAAHAPFPHGARFHMLPPHTTHANSASAPAGAQAFNATPRQFASALHTQPRQKSVPRAASSATAHTGAGGGGSSNVFLDQIRSAVNSGPASASDVEATITDEYAHGE